MNKYNDGYYHVEKDIEEYPEAWCYVIWSRRGAGKTYSALKYSYENNIPMVYIKRTVEDVNTICSASEKLEGFDPSPYVPINRDLGTNIKPRMVKSGIGAFYNCDEEGQTSGLPLSYVFALSGIKKIKGLELSFVDWIVFDEFIPQIGEIIRKGDVEGEQLLSLYMTIARDRVKRGKKDIKLILFANAENISAPVTRTLEVTDDMADLNASGKSHLYLKDRGILLHYITEEEVPLTDSEKEGIFKGMLGTNWHSKTFEGTFSNNDFSNVKTLSLKGSKPLIHIHYKAKDYYVYLNTETGMYYMCYSKNQCTYEFDLNRENEYKAFFLDWQLKLKIACIEERMKFQKYSMYDLIINYTDFFKLK